MGAVAGLHLVAAPAVEPITIEQARAQCRVTSDDEDALLLIYIAAARSEAESFTKRQLINATWAWKLPRFPRRSHVELPLPPLQTFNSVKYIDLAGTEQTWASTEYVVTSFAGEEAPPSILELAYGKVYPPIQPRAAGAVTVQFVAGYGADGAAVPAKIKEAMLLLIAESFSQRRPVVIGTIVSPAAQTAESLLWPFRVERWAEDC